MHIPSEPYAGPCRLLASPCPACGGFVREVAGVSRALVSLGVEIK